MNNEEAKFILGAYRAGGQDAGDATFAEAVQRTRDDPALGAWFARSRAHDVAMAAKLREVQPPAGLREAILAGARASAAQPAWWRRPAVWAVAASVAILLTLVTVWRSGGASLDASATALTNFALNDLRMPGHRGHEMAQGALKAWLTTAGSKLTTGQTLDVAQLQANGCRTLKFAGWDVVEVCFERGGVVFHFYAVPREAMPEWDGRTAPVLVARRGGEAAAVWSDRRFHYALATTAGMEELKRVL